MESNLCWCFWGYSGMPTSVSWQIFEFIFSRVNKMTFVSKGMGQISGKSHICNVKYGKLFDGEQQVLVFLKVLWYANKGTVTDFRINLFSGQKNDFCIKKGGSKFGKIAPLQCKIWEALRWRATGAGVFESTLVCQQVYLDRISNSSFRWLIKWLLYQNGWVKFRENRAFAM